MTVETLLIVLPAVTFGAVIVFALVSKARTKARMEDDNAPKSRLARDG